VLKIETQKQDATLAVSQQQRIQKVRSKEGTNAFAAASKCYQTFLDTSLKHWRAPANVMRCALKGLDQPCQQT